VSVACASDVASVDADVMLCSDRIEGAKKRKDGSRAGRLAVDDRSVGLIIDEQHHRGVGSDCSNGSHHVNSSEQLAPTNVPRCADQ